MNITAEFRPRLEFSDRLQSSYLFKFWSNTERGDFSINPELQFFARSDSGTGEFFALNFGYQLSVDNMLKLLNEEQYTDGDNTFSTNHGLIWRHIYNNLISFENSLIFESHNRATYHLDQYVYRSSFHYKYWKNVLHFSVTPYLLFEKEMKFHPAAALDLRIEFIF